MTLKAVLPPENKYILNIKYNAKSNDIMLFIYVRLHSRFLFIILYPVHNTIEPYF